MKGRKRRYEIEIRMGGELEGVKIEVPGRKNKVEYDVV